MSLDSASGGGAATPGWYTDPHDPSQLRWWSGESWTEHVSPGAGEPQIAEQVVAAPAVAQDAPLPSRRALRDPATEAVESAESALAAQAAQQQAEQAAADQAAADRAAAVQAQAAEAAAAEAAQVQAGQAAAAQAEQQAAFAAQQPAPVAPPVQPLEPVQPVQPDIGQTPVEQSFAAPVPPQQPSSPPVPTLPVAPTSFLEQQGYAPLDGAPADPNGWGQSAPAVSQAEAPQAEVPQQPHTPPTLPPVETAQPSAAQPADVQPNAWNQPVHPEQSVQPVQLVEPAQPSAAAPTAAQPNAWNQPVEPAQALPPVQAAEPNAWNQPVQPVQQAAPTQAAWGAPAAAPAAGMDSLFAAAPAEAAVAPGAPASQWGLAPADSEPRRDSAAAATEVAGSSSVWAWLIAISPILAAGSIMYVLLTIKPALTAWPFEAAVAAPYLLVLLFALADRVVLLQLGHTQPRSPAWALLSAPVYLIVRASETRREDGSGSLLTIVWFVSFLIAIGGIVGYGFLTHHALFAGLPT